MGDKKAALRWKFVLDGMVSIRPEMNDEGEVEYMMVVTEFSATKCYNPKEVDTAIDIAIYMAQRDISVYVH